MSLIPIRIFRARCPKCQAVIAGMTDIRPLTLGRMEDVIYWLREGYIVDVVEDSLVLERCKCQGADA